MDTWDAEPFWVWWEQQLALQRAMAEAQRPPAGRARVVARVVQDTLRSPHRQHLSDLRQGIRHWKGQR